MARITDRNDRGDPGFGGRTFLGASRAAFRGRRFFQEAKIDSLQALELLTRLENHFHIELPDYEVQGVTDFRTLAERIQARL